MVTAMDSCRQYIYYPFKTLNMKILEIVSRDKQLSTSEHIKLLQQTRLIGQT